MTGFTKILQISSNLSMLIDSLCFQLTINKPDTNSLSLLEIIEWRNNEQINQQQFRELYLGWLQSKNIQDLFLQKQIKTYPKEDLIQFQGPLKKFISINEITKTLQMLNALYNQIYLNKITKSQSISSKSQIVKTIQQAQKLFSILDTNGVINLRLSQIFFLTASILITQGKQIPTNIDQMKQYMKKYMQQMGQINGSISLRGFKNYFLQKNNKPKLKGIILILQEIQNKLNSEKDNTIKKKNQTNLLPQILQESILKWRSYPIFRNKQKKIEILKRILEQNQKSIYFHNSSTNYLYKTILKKYGQQLLDCVQIDEEILNQFLQIHQNMIAKYLSLIQKSSFLINKNVKPSSLRYIDQSSSNTFINYNYNLQNSIKQKNYSNSQFGTANKIISKTPTKNRTPQKSRKNIHDYTVTSNYKNKTPKNKAYTQIHNQFGSIEKKNNTSGYIVSGRQTTPTKSTLSFATEAPRTYRAAQKKGLQQNNFYDKLFFFRNKRVQSYQIVMKRLKNK